MIANRMNAAAAKGSAMMFEARKTPDGTYVVYMIDHMGMNEHKAITVFPGDVATYKQYGVGHLGRRYESFAKILDAEMLALYWRDLATDILAVFANGEKPRWVVDTFCGKILDTIYERARRQQPEGAFSPELIREVVSGLSGIEDMHLGMITGFVPFDYVPRSRIVEN